MKHSDHAIEFDLNEVLYFETGQEIAEMLSISLDPDIAIQTYDDYIQIRGIVLLQGEYKRSQPNPNESIILNESEFAKFIEKVYELDDERTKFSHRFPVEISIPPYLVDKLADITVTVEAFDYELPNSNTLKINASVYIHGIKNEKETQGEKATESGNDMERLENIASIDAREQATSQHMSEKDADENELRLHENLEEQKEQTENIKTEDINQSEVEETIKVLEEDTETTEEIQEVEQFEHEEEQHTEIDIQLNESPPEENEEVKDVQFLTDLFGGDEADSYSKMRIYITQEDDSIESIAKKYEISALQLMRDNNLTGESLEVGQLLYLPVKEEHE